MIIKRYSGYQAKDRRGVKMMIKKTGGSSLLALQDKLLLTSSFLQKRFGSIPETMLILGSGLGDFAQTLDNVQTVLYKDIPHFPQVTVEGHHGALVSGSCDSNNVLVMQGRFHYYEGYGMEEVTFPIRVAVTLGIKRLIVTNAAGCVNEAWQPGGLMLISDHINLMGKNPLRGPNNNKIGPRFPDMSEAYSACLRRLAHEEAAKAGIHLYEGVYGAVSGPSYETPAEVRFLRTIGVDAVGMSTVPEVIVSRHAGIEVLGISCLTNYAAGIKAEPLNHEEVVAAAALVKNDFITLLHNIVASL